MDLPIVRKVGAGVDKPEAEALPELDTHYQDLLTFLITRQKLPKDWQGRLQAIQAKCTEAIKTTPSHAATEVDYFKARSIRDSVVTKSERTIFGALQGPAATWDKIVRAYETKSVFLSECAQSLVQLISYDIPAFKKQLARLDQQVAEAERKQAESLKSASQSAASFEAECAKLGFPHRSPIRSSLAGLGSEIPSLLKSAVSSFQSDGLSLAASYYSSFVSFVHHGPASSDVPPTLPTLHEVIEGKTTLPASLNDPGVQDTSPVLDIDWGVEVGQDEPVLDMDIDWGLGSCAQEAQGTAPRGISWDFDLVTTADEGNDQVDIVEAKADGGEEAIIVNWDIAMEAGDDQSLSSERHEEEASPSSQQIMDPLSSAAIKRLEVDADYRSRLLDDLLELKSFLLQRKAELQKGSDIHTMILTGSCSDLVKSVDSASSLEPLLTSTQAALTSLTNERLKQLLLIKGSKRYFERLAIGLERRAMQEARLLAAAKDAESRGREARLALVEIQPKINEAVARVKEIRQGAQEALAILFGRKVNILCRCD